MGKNLENTKIIGLGLISIGAAISFFMNTFKGVDLTLEQLNTFTIILSILIIGFLATIYIFCRLLYLNYFYNDERKITKMEMLIWVVFFTFVLFLVLFNI